MQVERCKCRGAGVGAEVKVQVQRCQCRWTRDLEVGVQPVVARRQVRRARGPVHAGHPPAGHDPGPEHLVEELLGSVRRVYRRPVLGEGEGAVNQWVCGWVVPAARCTPSTSCGRGRPGSRGAPPPPASCWRCRSNGGMVQVWRWHGEGGVVAPLYLHHAMAWSR